VLCCICHDKKYTVGVDCSGELHTDACIRVVCSVHRHVDRVKQAAAKQLLPMLLAIGNATECDSSTMTASSTTQPTAEQLQTLLQAILTHLSPQYASSNNSSSSVGSVVAVQYGAVDVYLTLLWALVLKHPSIIYTGHDTAGIQVQMLYKVTFMPYATRMRSLVCWPELACQHLLVLTVDVAYTVYCSTRQPLKVMQCVCV
jgi:hypothetical protein